MIEQPQGIPTKGDIDKATEVARNNVSILEAEAGRLERLISTQKRELIVQENTKADLELHLNELYLKIESAEVELDLKEKESVAMGERMKVTLQTLAEKETSLIERSSLLAQKESDITQRVESVTIRESQLALREAELSEDEEVLELKTKKLKQVLNEIV